MLHAQEGFFLILLLNYVLHALLAESHFSAVLEKGSTKPIVCAESPTCVGSSSSLSEEVIFK